MSTTRPQLISPSVGTFTVLAFSRSLFRSRTSASDLSLETILVFPLVASRVPQRIAVHIAKSMPLAKVDRDTGDLSPASCSTASRWPRPPCWPATPSGSHRSTANEAELRSNKVALVPLDAPWLHMSYGLFYPRKHSLSRAAQLFVTQLRQVETALQVREQRAVARTNLKGRSKTRKPAAKSAKSAKARPASTRRRKPATRAR